MAKPSTFNAATLTEAEMIKRLSDRATFIEQKHPELAEKAATYREQLKASDSESQALRNKMLANFKAYPLAAEDMLNSIENGELAKALARDSPHPVSGMLGPPLQKIGFTDETYARMVNGSLLAEKPYNLAKMTENELGGRLSSQADILRKKFPGLKEDGLSLQFAADDPSAKGIAEREKLLAKLKANPALADTYLKPEKVENLTATEAKKFLTDKTIEIGGSPVPSLKQDKGFFAKLFDGSGGGFSLNNLSAGLNGIFNQIGQFFNKFIGGLMNMFGGMGGSTPVTQAPKPQPAAAPTTAKPTVTTAPSPGAAPKVAGADGPKQDDPKKDAGQKQDEPQKDKVVAEAEGADGPGESGKDAKDTLAKPDDPKDGQTEALPASETLAAGAPSAPLDWAGVQKIFQVDQETLDRLKPSKEADTAVAMAEPAARQSASGPKV